MLPLEFAREIALAAGLRNRLVHEYDEIDPRKLHEALQTAVKQIPVYLEAVRKFTETQGENQRPS